MAHSRNSLAKYHRMKKDDKALVNKNYLLEKFSGKGGWTFAVIPEVAQDKHAPFGWVKVKGFIDDVEIYNYRLQPMGNGKLFLPVKAAIRKAIKKEAGDWVHIVLYRDQDSVRIPEELQLCLQDVPNAFEMFQQLSDGQQKAIIEWIAAAKTDDTKVSWMVSAIDKIVTGQKLF